VAAQVERHRQPPLQQPPPKYIVHYLISLILAKEDL
jgi:hypothetical protein